MTPRYLNIIVSTILLAWAGLLQADTVSLKVSENVIATADFQPGDADKPLLIFIHGFLQTRQFATVRRLSESLNESGYPVLSPTLSLGISNRAKSLECESIHLHSLNGDTDEIAKWVEWADNKGYSNIVLIGHSAGSVNITAYLARGVDPVVSKTILISLTYYGSDRPAAFETTEIAESARRFQQNSDQNLHKFSLAYCKDYVSTAGNFLSYFDWSPDKIERALNRGLVDNYIIIGSDDHRIEKPWLDSLKKTRSKITIIEGANHFFDQQHEFDLLDTVEQILIAD